MENGGGFGNWIPNFASPYSPIPSPSSCSPFPDQLVVPPAGTTTSAAAGPGPGPGPHHNHDHCCHHSQHQAQAHHHLTCLKLGKRQYYAGDEPASSGGGSAKTMGGGGSGGAMKRERSSSACAVVPRCQVEGCSKALIDAKDYHRRHKVCEMHSKAPKVVVLGTEQRFCQQCSRFHAISEFDDSKRSCRRRLAGHNERRRKSSSGNDSIMRNPAAALETTIMGSRFPFLSQTSPGRALSLLSSKAYPWIPTAELSSRSSAALRELIAENRAALLPRQLFSNRSWHSVGYDNQSIISFGSHQDQATAQGTTQLLDGWNQFQESGRGLTLDLMQSPNSTSFEFLPRTNKSKEEEEECCEIWKSLEGTHVV